MKAGLIANLLGQITLGLLAMTICLPSMQAWVTEFDASQSQVQLTFSGYLFAFAATQLIYGPLSDRFGRRRILIAGLLIGVCGSLLAAIAVSLNGLIVARILQGAGNCAGMVLGRAMVQDFFSGSARTKIMAYVGMVLGVCPPLGMILGGWLYVQFGWRSGFIFIFCLSLVLLLAAWRGLPAGRSSKPRTLTAMALSYITLLRQPRYFAYCLIAANTSAAFYVFLAGAPAVFDAYDVSPDRLGWYVFAVTGAYIIGNLTTSRLVDYFADQTLMASGQLLSIVAVVLVGILVWQEFYDPLAVVLPLVLLGFGHGLIMPTSLVGLVGAVPVLAGAAAAFAGMLQQFLGAVGGYSVGHMNNSDAGGIAVLMGVFTLIAIIAQWRLSAIRHPP